MTNLPQRHSLVSQTAAILREEIAKGTWIDWLPGERALCESLQVSRNTLRAALAQMKADGSIRPEQGSGNRIVLSRRTKRAPLRSRDVAILTPDALERLRPTQALWIDELRAMLNERGCRLHVFHGRQYFRTNPARTLEKLVTQNRHACWILTLSNETVQRWFLKSGVPCIVAGSTYDGLALPFRDLDHRAVCRHAAGMLLGLGHRKLALLLHKSKRAGDIESEAGFVEGVRQSRQEGAELIIAHHDATVAGIASTLRRLTEQRVPPTAMLVANAYHYLTVASKLAQMGWLVPRDVSLVSRDEDPFLAFLVPAPARYVASPHVLAQSLLHPVLELLKGETVTQTAVRIMPDFIRGESVAPPG